MNDYEKVIKDTWDRHAEGYNERHNSHEDMECWKRILQKYACKEAETCLLDIGTGTGFLALIAAEAGYKCVGIDISKKMLESARAAARAKNLDLELIQCNWERLPFEKGKFDLIVSRCALWTMFNPEKALREWRRVLKTGGVMLGFCPEMLNADSGIPNHYSEDMEKRLPLKGADSKQLVETLSKCGFIEAEAIELKELAATGLFARWFMVKGKK